MTILFCAIKMNTTFILNIKSEMFLMEAWKDYTTAKHKQCIRIFTVRNKVAKVMVLQVCVCPWGVVSQHALQVVSQHALQLFSRGMLSQHALQVVSQHALQQVSGGVMPGLGGCLFPGGACSQGGPGPGGSAPTVGGLVSQHALRQTPPRRNGYCCGRYASHWNAFLLEHQTQQLRKVVFENNY